MRAGGKDRQREPDPGHFERFCNVVVPEMLTDVCHVSTAQIGEDILARAESYAMLDDTARDVLIAPFAEEIARPAGQRKPAASRASPPRRRHRCRISWPPGTRTQ